MTPWYIIGGIALFVVAVRLISKHWEVVKQMLTGAYVTAWALFIFWLPFKRESTGSAFEQAGWFIVDLLIGVALALIVNFVLYLVVSVLREEL
ncbi:hypothetical protein Y710_00300 [Gordonia sp. QH-12]|uniref:hypothetical protein n=1 Tax=Gordonia sp. QH-12 TaxID=1437876 RepID=UPI0007847BC4|nr:hypothetical protein [Gordonia sp. QH-12]KXT58725.1 hypothetical protein Y710_00300 [Gordonia sp. QH-12]